MLKQLPNFFTLLNLCFGCLSIIFCLQTEVVAFQKEFLDTIEIINIPESMELGALFIFLAALVDFLDGFVARLLKAESAMGAQLDSLSDVVSFGVAPTIIMWQLLRFALIKEADGMNFPQAWLWPALLLAVAAAWRLAKFNVSTNQKTSFSGLPSPAAGLVIASLPLAIFYNNLNFSSLLLNKWVLFGVIIIVAFLMVSNIKFFALKFTKGINVKQQSPLLLIAAIALISIFLFKWAAGAIILAAYLLVSIVFKNKIV
jgi:CDP-diacylglycerol---serine O-phosphatidyltransferase